MQEAVTLVKEAQPSLSSLDIFLFIPSPGARSAFEGKGTEYDISPSYPKSVLVIGSGPIVIGQACEFDYSGVQALKALREEGIRTILVNNNPATLMTDPDLADATYLEPIEPWALEAVLERERPEALLPTVGGQTALNAAVALDRAGTLERFGCRLIGASARAIRAAEDRELFKNLLAARGDGDLALLRCAHPGGGPRPGGRGGVPRHPPPLLHPRGRRRAASRRDPDEFRSLLAYGLSLSPSGSVLVEESLIGWKEFELEVIRDRADNVVVICSIENLDPMGVHTGDSVTVAPAQTLSDKETQWMRDWAKRVIRAVGVDTGGSNIQFALHPRTGRMVVIEMNPRVSRSSALASKATGYPIARVATQLALGYTLDELPNRITRTTPAAFEPALDYVVVKIPRWSFDKFRETDPTLSTHMKSIGEVMALGRTFKESFQKALRSVEIGRYGLLDGVPPVPDREALRGQNRHAQLGARLLHGAGLPARPFGGGGLRAQRHGPVVPPADRRPRGHGEPPAVLLGARPAPRTSCAGPRWRASPTAGSAKSGMSPKPSVRERRESLGITPVYLGVDTCAARVRGRHALFLQLPLGDQRERAHARERRSWWWAAAPTAWGRASSSTTAAARRSSACGTRGFATVMVNCNPETVSTDFDTADRLYFEPVTLEDVKAILDLEKPDGVILTFGGQTPLKLARGAGPLGLPALGNRPRGHPPGRGPEGVRRPLRQARA